MDASVPPNFDRVAGMYRWVEYFTLGPLLQRARTHFIPQLRHCRSAIALGDGDGRFLARLMQQNPELRATAVDISAAMLQRLRQNCEKALPASGQRLETQHKSALTSVPSAEVDLIATHFFLDCLTQPEVNSLVTTYSALLSPGTLWVVSDFALPRSPFLRPFAAFYIRSLYLAFRVLTGLRVTCLPDLHAALLNANFRPIARHEFLNGLIYTELWRRE